MQVARVAVVPVLEEAGGGVGHAVGINGNVIVAERGLDELALRLPEGAFAGEQSVAENRSDCRVIAGLEKIGSIANEDVIDEVGMRDLADGHAQKAIGNDVAEFARALSRKA